MYQQNYNPTGNVFLSTLIAAIPILTLLYFIALHPHRDQQGVKHLGISAPYAAFFGVIAAFLVSCIAFSMPFISAVSAFGLGVLARIHKGAQFSFLRRKINGEVWLPAVVNYSASARVGLLFTLRRTGSSEYSGYRKFSVDTSSSFEHSK